MSIQPLFYDPDFGYVVAIEFGLHWEWGQEMVVEFADGNSMVLGPPDVGSRLHTGVMKFLETMQSPQ